MSTKPCQDFTGSAAATSRCCLTLESPENSEAETEISYMVPQPPCCFRVVVVVVSFRVCLFGEREKESAGKKRGVRWSDDGSSSKTKKAKTQPFCLHNFEKNSRSCLLSRPLLIPAGPFGAWSRARPRKAAAEEARRRRKRSELRRSRSRKTAATLTTALQSMRHVCCKGRPPGRALSLPLRI